MSTWRDRSGITDLLREHGRFAGWALLALVACVPVVPDLLPVLLMVSIGALVGRHRASFGSWRERWPGWRSAIPWAMAFYLWHAVGLCWSSNLGFGLFDLQIKAPLLALPLLACLLPRAQRSEREALLFALALGSAFAVALKIVRAVARSIHSPEASLSFEIYSSSFAAPVHPSYLALYLCVAIAGWYLTGVHRAVPRALELVVLGLMCAGVVLCGSKLGWIVLVVLLPFIAVLKRRDAWVRKVLLASIVGTIGLSVVLLSISHNARERVLEAWHAAFEKEHDANASTSSAVRWLTWSAAYDLFRQHPVIGVGTGDIKDELMAMYAQRGDTTAFDHRLNAHDQFLQTAACLGAVGLIALLVMMVFPLIAASKGRDALLFAITAVLIVNLLVESMLEVQGGALFIALLFFTFRRGSTDDPERPSQTDARLADTR